MNAKHLIAHFDRFDSADVIPRLRRFVVDLAIRGHLASGSPEDGSVTDFLEGIVPESSLPSVSPFSETIPFRTPDHWAWVQLGSLTRLVMGQSPPGSTYNKSGEGLPLINGPVEFTPGPFGRTTINQYTAAPTKTCEEDDFLLCVRGSTTGRTNVAGFRACIGRGVAALQPLFPDQYMRIYVAHVRDTVIGMGRGIAFPSITRRQLEELPIPLPPLEEQLRIVAKVNDLMVLCDHLEEVQTRRERRRDWLATTSQRRLIEDTLDREAFRLSAGFYLERLPRLATRAEHISELRRTILTLAVRGALVRQKDEGSAAELFTRLVKHADPKKRDLIVDIRTRETKLEIPASWQLVPLIALGKWAIGSGFPKSEQGGHDGPYFFLKVSDMNRAGNEKFITTSQNTIDESAAVRMKAKLHPPGTIIFPKIGGAIATNKRRILTRPSAIDNNCLGITLWPDLSIEWCYLLLSWLDLTEYQSGTAMPALQQGVLSQIPIGLPPAEEQQRIVARFNELMVVCDGLEEQLRQGSQGRSRLLEAVLHEALNSAA